MEKLLCCTEKKREQENASDKTRQDFLRETALRQDFRTRHPSKRCPAAKKSDKAVGQGLRQDADKGHKAQWGVKPSDKNPTSVRHTVRQDPDQRGIKTNFRRTFSTSHPTRLRQDFRQGSDKLGSDKPNNVGRAGFFSVQYSMLFLELTCQV